MLSWPCVAAAFWSKVSREYFLHYVRCNIEQVLQLFGVSIMRVSCSHHLCNPHALYDVHLWRLGMVCCVVSEGYGACDVPCACNQTVSGAPDLS
jgi:hypothetical protein